MPRRSITSGLDDFPDLYNITPGINTWIARAKDGKPALYSYVWGLVPYWSKDPKKGARPVNARAETAHEKPMFRKLIRERRCLIPANCYYEWKQMPVGKRPYCIRMEDEVAGRNGVDAPTRNGINVPKWPFDGAIDPFLPIVL